MRREITRFPAVKRDIAVVLPDSVSYAAARELIEADTSGLLQEVRVFDIYMGGQVPEGYKSMAFRLLFRSQEKTLTENEVIPVVEEILGRLKDRWGASQR